MTREQATKEARKLAHSNRVTMVVVDAPIENAEDDTPFGYCPEAAKNTLFRFGTIVDTIKPDHPSRRPAESTDAAQHIQRDPTASFWLKAALRSALDRDPVDALSDAETLVAVLSARVERTPK